MRISNVEHHQYELVSSSELSEPKQSATTLLVQLQHDVSSCIAFFSGSITDATRTTIDGVADLLAGEQSVVLDFSRVEEIDSSGADAVATLARSVQARGAHLQIAQPTRRAGISRGEDMLAARYGDVP
jgi:anti-anti-sigma regulatory factor